MRVLLLNVDCGAGSTGRICADLARELINRGHEAIVAYGRNCSQSDIDISFRIGNKFDVYNHVLYSRLFDRTGFASNKTTKRFIEWIKNYNPDVINIHNVHGYWINIKILFTFLNNYNKPVVWTLHDCWPFTGHCAYFDFAKCEKWKAICKNCPQKKAYPKSLFVDSSKKNYLDKKALFKNMKNLTIVTPSKWLSHLVKESFLNNHKTIVIHNGIDLQQFRQSDSSNFRNKYEIGDTKIVLGVATPWTKRKGLADFIKLSSMISNDFVVFLIGLSEEQISLLPPNVKGIKKTSSIKELAEAYSSAYVFFNPTYEDNYPTTNLEAQACGTPVITYNTGGSVESCPTNQVVNAGDLESVVSLLKNNKLVLSDTDFSKESMIQQYLCLFEDLLI